MANTKIDITQRYLTEKYQYPFIIIKVTIKKFGKEVRGRTFS